MHRALLELGLPRRTRFFVPALYEQNFGYVTLWGGGEVLATLIPMQVFARAAPYLL